MATVGLSCIVSEVDGDFSRKSQIFPTPCILRSSRCADTQFPLELSIGAWGEKLES